MNNLKSSDWAGKYPPAESRRKGEDKLQDVHFRADPLDLSRLERVRTDPRSPYYGLWSTPSALFRQIVSVAAKELVKRWDVPQHEAAALVAQEDALRASAFIDHRLVEMEIIVDKLVSSLVSLVNNRMYEMAGRHLDNWIVTHDGGQDEEWKEAYAKKLLGHHQFRGLVEDLADYSKLVKSFLEMYQQ